jgi:predicted Fe-Mo cluster-binding NifX family protein
VKAIISGHVGPKAFRVLQSAGIDAYAATNITVNEAIKKFQEGKCTKLTGADVEGHW